MTECNVCKNKTQDILNLDGRRSYRLIFIIYYYIYLTANGLTPGGSSAGTKNLHTNSTQNTKNKTYIAKQKKKWSEKCGPCPVCASYTLAFALQLREKHGKTSVKVHPHMLQTTPYSSNIPSNHYLVIRLALQSVFM